MEAAYFDEQSAQISDKVSVVIINAVLWVSKVFLQFQKHVAWETSEDFSFQRLVPVVSLVNTMYVKTFMHNFFSMGQHCDYTCWRSDEAAVIFNFQQTWSINLDISCLN
jgi:hypothetical protein